MRLVIILCSCLLSPAVLAWGAAGHRLVACLAWEQLTPRHQVQLMALLRHHPDSARWLSRPPGDPACSALAEAATWPDDIKQDPRFDDAPTAPSPARLQDTARHRSWHYVDYDANGEVAAGELAEQLARQANLVGTGTLREASTALPWLVHLVADAHQPLHVGRSGDQGGNAIAIVNPYNTRQPQTNLHAFWDELPGPPWLRGARLMEGVQRLKERYIPAAPAPATVWLHESHALLARVYPPSSGPQPVTIDGDFLVASRTLAEQRLVDAGRRLADMLATLLARRVSRETTGAGE